MNGEKIIFLLKCIGIFFFEGTLFLIFGNYHVFISNLAKQLSTINILFVKVFQAFALNNHIIDEEMNNELLKYTDHAPWDSRDVSWDTIHHLEKEYQLIFHDYEPINSGMISLVFKATEEKTGELFILKMKRRGIEVKINEAIENLLFLVDVCSVFPMIKRLDLKTIITKNTQVIRKQCDFLMEVNQMNHMTENCKGLKYVKIPKVYPEVTCFHPNVIMMEYIDGKTIDQINSSDHTKYAELVIKFGIVTLLLHGVTHGDLHSGNILFLKDDSEEEVAEKQKYKIGILDFGIVYEIDANLKNNLLDICTELFHDTSQQTALKLLFSGMFEPVETIKYLPKKHFNHLIELLTKNIDNGMKQANQIQVYKFLSELDTYIHSHYLSVVGLRTSDAFIQMQLAMAMTHGVTMRLCKNVDYIQLTDRIINEMFHMDILQDDL